MANYYVYYHNKKSDEYHRAVVNEGNRYTMEQCNWDQMAEDQVTEEAALHALSEKPEAACGHCMKDKE